MMMIDAARLERIARAVFQAAGCGQEDADFVAHSLVEANLMGHDSHGVIHIPGYIEEVEKGNIVPDAEPSVVKEGPNTALVAGNWGFGQVACKFAMELAIAKAKENTVAVVGAVQCNHNGRLGQYPTMAASQGLIAMMAYGGDRGPRSVAPYGGRARILGTNPYAFAVPAGQLAPFVADFATSIIAAGKVAVARANRTPLPPGSIVDRDGNPSVDPEDFYTGGALLPFAGHKGYALALLAELLGGFLMGGDIFGNEARSTANFMLVINPEAFRPIQDYQNVVENRFRQIKTSPTAPGFEEVLIPGEPEMRTLAKRQQEGIPIAEETWEKIISTAQKLGATAVL